MDYTSQLDSIGTQLDTIKVGIDEATQGLMYIHQDINRIMWIAIALAFMMFLWSILKNIKY